MIKLGITGGIGSGKSIVCKVFSLLDVPVYNADIWAKILMNKDLDIKKQMISLFGHEIYDDFGCLNKSKLRSLIFNNQANRKKVNNIVHPVVENHFLQWCNQHAGEKYIIKESAILFESSHHKNMDIILTVTAPENNRINRITARDSIKKELVLKIIESQTSDSFKAEKSDYVICNDNKSLIVPEILNIHNQIIKKVT